MHASVFQPDDFLPRCLADFLDDILVSATVGPFPGIEHVKDGLVHRISGIHRRQSALGRSGVGLLGMGAFGDRQNPGFGPFLQNLDRTAKTGPPYPDHQ